VIGAVATKAAIFYDGSQLPLDQQGQSVRDATPPNTITITNPDDMVMLFEFFNDMKYGMDAAKQQIGPAPVQKDTDMQSVYDKTYRKWQEDTVAATAPFEGQIDHTDFDISLPATWAPYTAGCTKAILHVPMDSVQFMLFRAAMGSNLVLFDVTMPKSVTVAKLQFAGENHREFNGESWPICVDQATATTIMAGPVSWKGDIHRTHVGADWTGTGEFIDGHTNAPIAAKKPKK